MSLDPALPRARLPLPPEVLTHVLVLAVADLPPYERSHQLARFALVSSQLQPSTYDVLYGDLRVLWKAEVARRLLRSLQANANLGAAVRSFSATSVWRGDWQREWIVTRKVVLDAEAEEAEWARLEAIRDEYKAGTTGHAVPSDDEQSDDYGFESQDDYDTKMEAGARRAWIDAGHERWDADRPEDVEELLETISHLTFIRHLSLTSFHNRHPRARTLNGSKFRHLIAGIPSLALVDVYGIFGGSVLETMSGLKSLSFASSSVWTATRRQPAKASPVHLTLVGQPNLQREQFSSLIGPNLRNLTISLKSEASSDPDKPTLIHSWTPLLSNATNLDSLTIYLIMPKHVAQASDYFSKFIHEHSAPLDTDQEDLGAHLASSSIATLSLDWWPNRTLLASLPQTLLTLELGSSGIANPETCTTCGRAQLAELLQAQRPPGLRTVALPVIGKKPDPRPIPDSPDLSVSARDLLEFVARRGELERLGLRVRASRFGGWN